MARLDAHFDDSGILDLLDWFGWAIIIETHSGSLTRDLFSCSAQLLCNGWLTTSP